MTRDVSLDARDTNKAWQPGPDLLDLPLLVGVGQCEWIRIMTNEYSQMSHKVLFHHVPPNANRLS